MTEINIARAQTLEVTEPAEIQAAFPVDQHECSLLVEAGKLFQAGFPNHALLDLWNAAVSNLRRRVEAYSVKLFESVVKSEPGRKSYNKYGDTLSERWKGVDDFLLLKGAKRLGLISPKAHKCLETINWMRNHASPSHPTDEQVTNEDVAALALMLEENLFKQALPDPGHSVAALFEPVDRGELNEDQLSTLNDQIRSYRPEDLRTCFGFLLEKITEGEEPSYTNARQLLPTAWELATPQLRKTVGENYYAAALEPETDDTPHQGAAVRLLDFLIEVDGFRYIPESGRARLFRRAARQLAAAKDASYGWSQEEAEARTLLQFGYPVPDIAFEEVYQEILSVYCGNFWGRSDAHSILEPFIDSLGTSEIRKVATLFTDNERVQSELVNQKPKENAINLLNSLKAKLTIATHKGEVQEAIEAVKSF
jgi:hypothetical protein